MLRIICNCIYLGSLDSVNSSHVLIQWQKNTIWKQLGEVLLINVQRVNE